MKALCVICVEMMVLVTSPLWARDESAPADRFVNTTVEQSEQSLRIALESRSPGMRLSAANTVRQLKELLPEEEFSSLIIPLMRIVKDEDAETSSRIVAAVALHELHSARGDFAISRVAEFSGNPRVRHICTWLTHYQELEDRKSHRDELSSIQSAIKGIRPDPLPESALLK